MGSFYQPPKYLTGGSTRKNKKTRTRSRSRSKSHKGGFQPSIMGGVIKGAAYLSPLVMRQGSKLVQTHFKNKTMRKKRK